ncbi:MAG: acyltransferase family protein [Clostridia bacterium]|nr:acyltransferase family protein [Clostridia bacterium]
MLELSDKRDTALDLAKGIGIFLVFMGHIDFPEEIIKLIYSFHMPLFFMCSGYLYKTEYDSISTSSYIKKQAKSLLYPYFVLGTIIIIYNSIVDVFFKRFLLIQLGKRVIALLYGAFIWENNYEYIGVFWFLPALFCAQIIFHTISRTVKRLPAKIIVGLFVVAFGFLVSSLIGTANKGVELPFNIRLPYCFDISLISTGFILFGHLIRYLRFSKVINFTIGTLSLVAGLFLSVLNIKIDVLYLKFGSCLLFLLSAALSCTGIILLCKWISAFDFRFSLFGFLGKMSLLLMAIHMYVLSYAHRLLAFLNFDNPITELVLTLAVSVAIAEVIQRKLKWIYKYDKCKKV